MNTAEIINNIGKREIEFRAFWIDKKIMEYDVGDLEGYKERNYFIDEDGEECGYLFLMQYTGLKDKNGKEIYEGDITKGDTDTRYGVVLSQNGKWVVRCEDYTIALGEYLQNEESRIVVGNIFENPELLTQ